MVGRGRLVHIYTSLLSLTLLLSLAPNVQGSEQVELDSDSLHAITSARAQLSPKTDTKSERPLIKHDGALAMALFEGAWRVYKRTLSPHTGATCAFEPSCSRFGLDAVSLYGPLRGVLMTLDRMQRDHPYAHHYYKLDPSSGRAEDPAEEWCKAIGKACP